MWTPVPLVAHAAAIVLDLAAATSSQCIASGRLQAGMTCTVFTPEFPCRYHHLHCETPLDPHSSYEGFWWSHMGWILENDATLERVGDRTNAGDMAGDPFYDHMEKHYTVHLGLMFAVLFAIGGFPAMVWGGALRIVWVWHVTWLVNSACHLWGTQTYNTGDLSMNNWWVGLLAWGEGWHNNHHAFEFSARHGLEWWQFDMTWQIIAAMQSVGLATAVKLPSEKQKKRLAF